MYKYKKWKPPPTKTEKVAQYILLALAAGAFLTSPYAGYFLVRGAIHALFRKKDFNREARRLEKRGYVALTKTPNGWMVRLTKLGKKRLKAVQIENLTISREEKWDRKWRLFSFDIPEKYRSARNSLRDKLKELGLYNIQRSLFAYPFNCKKELLMVSEYYGVEQYTTYIEASFIDIDKELRRDFEVK